MKKEKNTYISFHSRRWLRRAVKGVGEGWQHSDLIKIGGAGVPPPQPEYMFHFRFFETGLSLSHSLCFRFTVASASVEYKERAPLSHVTTISCATTKQ